MRSSHKYIFYFYPTWRENERGEIEEIRGSFRFFERVKDGKAAAAENGAKVRPSENILSSSSLKNAALVSQKN